MAKKKTKKYTDDEVAVQHNGLINTQQSLSLIQKRIFYLAMKQIKKGDKAFKRYYVDLSDLTPTTSDKIYSVVKKELKELRKKEVIYTEKINGKSAESALGLVAKSSQIKGTGQVYIDMHPDMRDMLLDLKKYFTRVPVVELIACRSTYGQRLYELLYQFSDTGIRLMTVEELRKKLNLQNKYKNFAHFRRRVLEQAQKDVSEHTNMEFTWEEIKAKKGRKIERLMFDIEVSDPEQTEMDFSAPKVDRSQYKTIQKHLREICEFSDANIDKVLLHLQQNPDDKSVVGKLIHKTEIRIKDGEQGNAKKVNNPEKWALNIFKKTIPNFK